MKVISMSSPTNSVMWRWVNEFSERKTGPTSKTRSRSPINAICLYSCGDCARYAKRSKYSTLKTSAPPSDAVPTSLGEWISVKPWPRRKPRKSLHTPDWMRMIAWFAGVRRSSTRLFSRTSWLTRGRASPPAAAAAASAASSAAVGSGRAASSSWSGSSGTERLTQKIFLTCSSTSCCEHDEIGTSGHVTSAHTSTTDSFGSAPAKATTEASPPTTACTVWICWRSWRNVSAFPCFRDVATRARTHTSLPLSGGASAATRSQLRPDLVSDLMKRLPNECSPYVSSVSDGPSADSSFFACAFARSAWRAAFSAAFFALASRSAAFFASRAAASSSGV